MTKTKKKRKTALERDFPKVYELAEKLGQKLYKRSGAYWLSSIQLTYQYEMVGVYGSHTEKVKCPISWENNGRIAEKKLQQALDEMEKQQNMNTGERINYICEYAKKIFKEERLQRGGFNTVGYEFLDHITILSNYSMCGWLTIGNQKVHYDKNVACVDELIDRLKEVYLNDCSQMENFNVGGG